jgi:hypothetical protein
MGLISGPSRARLQSKHSYALSRLYIGTGTVQSVKRLRCGLDDLGIEVSLSSGSHLSYHRIQDRCPMQWLLETLSPEADLPGRETDNSSADLHFPIRLLGVVINYARDKFPSPYSVDWGICWGFSYVEMARPLAAFRDMHHTVRQRMRLGCRDRQRTTSIRASLQAEKQRKTTPRFRSKQTKFLHTVIIKLGRRPKKTI